VDIHLLTDNEKHQYKKLVELRAKRDQFDNQNRNNVSKDYTKLCNQIDNIEQTLYDRF
jgi:hypothetical protein